MAMLTLSPGVKPVPRTVMVPRSSLKSFCQLAWRTGGPQGPTRQYLAGGGVPVLSRETIPGPAEVVPRPAVLVAAVLVAAPPALVRRRDAGRRDVGQRYAAQGAQGSSAGLAAQPGGLLLPDQL